MMSDTETAEAPSDSTEVHDEPESETDLQVEGQSDDDAAEPEVQNEAAHKAAQKAAKYRTELRTAQAERDALSERLNTLQRREVERLAGEKMAEGGDIWLSGTELTDMLDEDGNVDVERVSEAVSGIVASKPHWGAKAVPKQLRTGSLKSGTAIAPPTTGWSDLLGRKE